MCFIYAHVLTAFVTLVYIVSDSTLQDVGMCLINDKNDTSNINDITLISLEFS
jgi:hypothetical protein